MSPLLCPLDRLQQKLLLCIWYFSVGKRTTQWHCPSCVTTGSLVFT